MTVADAAREHVRLPQLVRALALIGLLLLPVEMRAGTERPHAHSLFQLLLDASDGKIDHHAPEEADEAGHHEGHEREAAASGSETREPDLPVYSDVIAVSASLAALALIAALLSVPRATTAANWLSPCPWRDRIPALEPPPPRATWI